MIYIKSKIKWGEILVLIDDKFSIAGLWFEGQKYFPTLDQNAIVVDENKIDMLQEKGIKMTEYKKAYELFKQFKNQIREYENGDRVEFDLPLAPVGSDFRQMVWRELLQIPLGKTITYGDIAKKIAKEVGKKSMSAQAVGGAVGHNPISLIIPCHRVVGTNGKLTGYAGGVDKKEALLIHEGVEIINNLVK